MGHTRLILPSVSSPGWHANLHPGRAYLIQSVFNGPFSRTLPVGVSDSSTFWTFYLGGTGSHLLLPLLCAFNFSLKVNRHRKLQVEKKWVTIWNWPWKNMLPPNVTAACPTRLTMFLLEWALLGPFHCA